MSGRVDTAGSGDGVTLRPVVDGDLAFLERVYGSSRADELAATDWTDEQKAAFIGFQFRAQHAHYQTHYHDAHYRVIEQCGHAVGRLYLHWRSAELRIVDITLLPEARGHGIGTMLLDRLIAQAAQRGCTVSIHVEKTNPAMRLYRRLGFRRIGEHGVYDLMERPLDAQ